MHTNENGTAMEEKRGVGFRKLSSSSSSSF